MVSKGSLQVSPDTIVFRDLDSGESDTIDIWARNVGSKSINVRFSLPENPFFVLNAKANILTAPGLEAHAVLKYTASTSQKETNALTVTCNDSSISIPIISYPPTPAVQPGTTKIDFGTVTMNTGQIRSFQFTNFGAIEGKYLLKCEPKTNSLKISPVEGTIGSNATQDVMITFKAETPGPFKCQIIINVDNNSEKIQPIDVIGNVVDQSITIHGPKGEEFSELNFQHLFYGSKKVIPIILRNKGSCLRTFSILPLRLDSTDYNSPVFTISPMNGTIKAYSDLNLNVTFYPPRNDQTNDSEQQYSAIATVEIAETGQTISFNAIGTAVCLNYEITQLDFDFGQLALKSKKSEQFVVKNNSPFLPLSFNIKQVAQFKFNPSSLTLKPKESKTISLTFQPVNLGVYNIKTHISFCGGIERRDINLIGSGVTTLSPDPNYQRPEIWDTYSDAEYYMNRPKTQYGLTINELHAKQERRKQYDSYIAESAEKRANAELRKKAKENATKEAMTLLAKKKTKFTEDDINEYVTTHIQQLTGEQEDPVNLGLEHCEGMVPPEPPMIRIMEPFKLPESIGLFSTLNPRSKRGRKNKNNNGVFDDKVLIKKKFKSKPTTQTEINDCSKKLQKAQQVLVVASHQSINFGNVSVFSTEKRSFQITNNLQQFILVSLKCEHDELKESGPQSQVVPPHQTCGFDIVIHNDDPEIFSKAIEYTINNDLTYSVAVNADIVPIDLTVEPDVLQFSFDEGYSQPYIKSFVKLINNSNSPTEFQWSGFDKVFSIHNKSGKICPHGSYSTEITYKPDTNSHHEAIATVSIVGGPSKKLKMIGDTGKPKLQLAKKVVSFGLIPLNTIETQDLKIKNVGTDDAIFSVTPNLTDVISIVPTGGRIKANESTDLHINVKSEKSSKFEIPILVSMCGGQPLTFSITGQAECPRIETEIEDLNFESVYLGSTHTRKITIRNVGLIPATAFLDLSSEPEFHIEYDSSLSSVNPDEKKNSISIVTDINEKEYTDSELETESVNSINPSEELNIEENTTAGFIYKMNIHDNSEVSFSIVFQPRNVNEYDFDLPLTITNIDPDVAQSFTRKVTAKSMQAPIFPSATALNFGIQPLFDSENPNSRPPSKHLILKNEYTKDIQFYFDDSTINGFKIEPLKGKIKYASNMTIFVSFMASDSIPYLSVIPLHVITDKGDIKASEIQLIGVGSLRAFQPSLSYVSLPPVPLGIKSERTIYILNTSFMHAMLKSDMPIIEKQFPLSVTFPDGNEMKNSTRQLPVSFSFVSPKPMSFSTIVAFVDDQGNSTSVTVSCVADNSIFTLYPLLSQNCCRLSAGQGNPIKAMLMVDSPESDFIAKFLAIENFTKFNKKQNVGETTKQTIDFLVKFLNSLILSTKIRHFPEDIVNSNGEIIIEMISNLCRSKKPNGLNNVLPKSSDFGNKNTTNHYAAMKNLLSFLASQGAMIPDIKPEFLLSQTEFSEHISMKITKQLLGIDYYGAPELSSFDQQLISNFTSSTCFNASMLPHLKMAESLYKTLSIESWTRIILQVLKLYLFSKLHPDKILQIPGVQDALTLIKPEIDNDTFNEINRPNRSLNSSNYFSSAESMLLKWITITYCSQNLKSHDIVIDYNSLHNPRYFLMLLKAHILNRSISLENDDNKNYEILLNTMSEFRMDCIPTINELQTGNEIVMSLLSYQFMELLPHFLPMTTVEFECALSKQVVQSITVTNPSKVPISYEAKIEGSQNFRALEETLEVGPNETAEFLVEYIARKLDRETAILSLIPGKVKTLAEPKETKSQVSTGRRSLNQKGVKKSQSEPHVFASTIVINLASAVSYDGPLKTIEIDGNIYETKKMSINVENALQMPGRINIISRQINEDPKVLIERLFKNPKLEQEYPEQKTLFETNIVKHQTFLFEQDSLTFESKESIESIDMEFTPISLGTFRCFILFYNEKHGQYVYEIVAKSNLPNPQPFNVNLKTECGNQTIDGILLERGNKYLFNAMGYVTAKQAAMKQYMSEAKFRETIQFNIRELNNLFLNAFQTQTFHVEVTSSYFKAPETFKMIKTILQNNEEIDKSRLSITDDTGTILPIEFNPEKPGEYPCRVILKSKNDVRVIQINAIGLATCKTMSVEMTTASGRPVMQGIPFFNPSETVWHFKATVVDGTQFTCPPHFMVQPNSIFDFPISFQTGQVGTYTCELEVVNIDKEAVYKYNVSAEVVDPSAEDKIEIEFKARSKFTQKLNVKPFIENGTLDVTTDIPILTVPSTVQIVNGQLLEPFIFTAYTVESGISMGTITFTDQETKAYIWYVIQMKIDQPDPEEVIEVNTVARKTVTVKIPVHNPSNNDISFDVEFKEKDFFGDKQFVIKPYDTSVYQLTFCPLTQMKRVSQIAFHNKNEGEFLYLIDITVSPPDVCVMAPLQASIGQSATGYIFVENPLDEIVHFQICNDNATSFKVNTQQEDDSSYQKKIISRSSFELQPHEKRQVDVVYIPSMVGSKESALIGLKSPEIGDWFYRFAGVGKPPQPSSPIIVDSMLQLSSSGQIIFSNPYQSPTRFELSISTEYHDVFNLLNKRRTVTLTEYNETLQVAFSFTPPSPNQFTATIIVATIGMNPEIRWTYPVIGNTQFADEGHIPPIKVKSHSVCSQEYKFTLIGERENYPVEDYRFICEFPEEYSFLNNVFFIHADRIVKNEESPYIVATINFRPRRPVTTLCQVTIENKLNQQWRFPIKIIVETEDLTNQLIIESQLGYQAEKSILVNDTIQNRSEFEAYFLPGAATEFTVVPEHGFIEPSMSTPTVLPIEIIYRPVTYGKMTKGVLVIDTIDTQYLIEVVGKVPDYAPPAAPLIGTINTGINDSIMRTRNALGMSADTFSSTALPSPRKRNYIKDNIDKAKVVSKPTSSRRSRTPFKH